MYKKRENETKYIALEIIGVAFLASAGIFIRKSTLPPINIGFWRLVCAIPILFIFAFKDLKTVNKKDIPFAFLSGIFLAGDLIFFNTAMINTSLANTNLFTNLTAFLVVPISYFIFKEKIPKFYLVGLIISILGIVILVTGKAEPDKSSYFGDICAAIACIFYSSFCIAVYKLRERMTSSSIMFIGAFGTIATLICVLPFTEGFMLPNCPGDIYCSLGLALCIQAIGHNLVAHSQGFINLNLGSAIRLLQPVIAALYSLIIFNETLSTKEKAGMVIVIIGLYICKKQYTK